VKLSCGLIVPLTVIAVISASGSPAEAQQPPPAPDRPVVITSGEGIIRATPDRAFVAISAESRARNPVDAQRQNAEAMSAVQQKLKEAGIAPEAIQTRAYDLQPEFDFVNGRRVLRGYVARNRIEVRVDDIQRLGPVIDLAVTTGATNVDSVRFDLRNRDVLEREALKLAVADARARAEAAAAGAGQSIERVLRIEEQRAVSIPPPWPMARIAAEAAATPETPIATGELEIRGQVTLTAALK
jgi:uncharacterized protein